MLIQLPISFAFYRLIRIGTRQAFKLANKNTKTTVMSIQIICTLVIKFVAMFLPHILPENTISLYRVCRCRAFSFHITTNESRSMHNSHMYRCAGCWCWCCCSSIYSIHFSLVQFSIRHRFHSILFVWHVIRTRKIMFSII